MTDKLKLCPFCGEEAEYRPDHDGWGCVRCKAPCCCTQRYATPRENAIEAWNSRVDNMNAIADVPTAQVEIIYKLAIKTFGERKQEEVAIEELAELIQAISHKHRGREHNIPEEIADVEICLEQLKIINNCAPEVKQIKAQKIHRLYERVCEKCF